MTDSPTPSAPSPSATLVSQAGLKRVISVEAPANRVAEAFDKEFRKIQQSVTLRGFRKGRAPLGMIKTMYGDEVRHEALERLISETYPGAVAELQLRVAAYPRITDFTLTEGAPLRYTAEVEVFPEIEKVDITGLTFVSETVSVSEKDVDEVIEGLRKRMATYTTVDRPAGDSDIVMTDIAVLDDPKGVVREKLMTDSPIDLGATGTMKEFRDALIGARAGDTKEVSLTYPADYGDANFAGAAVSYRFMVKNISERHLPALDDSLAKAQGLETLAQLRERITTRMTDQRETDSLSHRNNQLISQRLCFRKIFNMSTMNNIEDTIREDNFFSPVFQSSSNGLQFFQLDNFPH